ncbi:MAG: secD [Ignavibacteria bacterium]|nr:secD [Ignavibacteria bacterium]
MYIVKYELSYGGLQLKKYYKKLLLVIVPILAAVYLLYPTYRVYQLEQIKVKAETEANQAKTPADSLAIIENFHKNYGDVYKKAKASQLKLGLDLRGGMYVTIEADLVKLIEETAQRESIDDIFTEVLEKTNTEATNSEESALDIFIRNFDKIARPKGKSLISYFDIGDIKDASEEKIIEKLRQDADKAIDRAKEVIRQRIDTYGVSEPNIQKQGASRIVLELPGVQNEDEVRKLLSMAARLEFKLVRSNEIAVKAFKKIDDYLAQLALRHKSSANESEPASTITEENAATSATTSEIASKPSETTTADSAAKTKKDTADPYAGLSKEEAQKKYSLEHLFTSLFATYYHPEGENSKPQPVGYNIPAFPDGDYSFYISKDSIPKFQEILKRKAIKAIIPYDLDIVLEAKPTRGSVKSGMETFNFHVLKREPELTGEVITDARASFDQSNNQPMVLMSMNSDGSERWARITGANLQKRIAIVLDERIYSAPTVQSKITGGNSQITGMANTEEAHLLEIVLKAGALPTPIHIIEERVVGPSLGEDSINSGVNSVIYAFILVVVFMTLYYSKGGIVANFAVILNVVLIISILAALGGTLTLPGIGAVILTIGMAVDVNILIFERIREEMSHGRSLKSSIDEGFSKALTAIIDSQVTTLISGFILYLLGTGPIQGFAINLIIGIVFTLFTGIFVSRAIIDIFIIRGATRFSFGQSELQAIK